jgi:hypothetical protein
LAALPPRSLVVVGYDPEKETPRGVDRIVYEEARQMGLETETHPAEWSKYGKPAGYIRNSAMASLGADLCVAFWLNKSFGTKHMIDEARRHGIPVEVITE